MKVSTSDVMSAYSVVVTIAAVVTQSMERSNGSLIALIGLAELAALWPVVTLFPLKWRGKISDHKFAKLTRVLYPGLILGCFGAILLHSTFIIEPRAGLLLAFIATVNVVSFVIFVADRPLKAPKRWNWVIALQHFTVGTTIGIARTDVVLISQMGLLCGLYGLSASYSSSLTEETEPMTDADLTN